MPKYLYTLKANISLDNFRTIEELNNKLKEMGAGFGLKAQTNKKISILNMEIDTPENPEEKREEWEGEYIQIVLDHFLKEGIKLVTPELVFKGEI